MVALFHSCMVALFHSCMVALFHSCMVALLHSCVVALLHSCMVAWSKLMTTCHIDGLKAARTPLPLPEPLGYDVEGDHHGNQNMS